MPNLSPLCGTIDRASAPSPRFSFIMAAIERGDEPTETERFLETISVASQGALPPLFHGGERVEYHHTLEGQLSTCGITDDGKVLFIARQARAATSALDTDDVTFRLNDWDRDEDPIFTPAEIVEMTAQASERRARWLEAEPVATPYKTIPLAPTMVFEHEDGRQIEVFVLGEPAMRKDMAEVAKAFDTTLDWRIPIGQDEWFKINGGSSRAYAIRELREAVSRFGSPTDDFIKTYLDICEGSIALSCDGERLRVWDIHPLLNGKLSFSPLGEDGVTCFVRDLKGLDTDYFYEAIEPTFKLTRKVRTEKGHLKYDMTHVWVIKTPASVADAAPIARAFGMKSLDMHYAILPDHDLTVTSAREYITNDKGEFVRASVRPATLEAMRRTYADEIGNAPVDASAGFHPVGSVFNNANVARSFNESALPTASIEMSVTAGGEGDQFASTSLSPADFLKRFATSASGEYFPGTLHGETVQSVSAFVFDLPNHSTALVDEYLSATNHLVVRHSSNLATETLVAAADISKHAPGSKLDKSHDIGVLLQEAKGYQGIKLGVSSFVGIEKAKTRFKHIEVGHQRIIIPLAAPISIEEEGAERVSEIRKALAAKLGIPCGEVAIETSYPFPVDGDRVAVFGSDVLFDVESLGLPKRKKKTDKQKKREKVEKEDKARGGVDEAIEALTKESTTNDIGKVLDLILDANLDKMTLDRVFQAIKKNTGVSIPLLKSTYNWKKTDRDRAATGKTTDPTGRAIFPYNGEWNSDELERKGVRELKKKKLANGAPIYTQTNGVPLRLDIPPNGRPNFTELNDKGFWSEINTLVTMVKRTEQGDGARQFFDEKTAKHIHAQAFRWLEEAPEIIHTPIILADGTLIETPGFYKEPNILLADNGLVVPAVSENPTKEEAEASAKWIDDELLHDFPFCDIDEKTGKKDTKPSRANAYAMIITPFMRLRIDGLTPFFFITKPQPGTGGTLLATLAMMLFDGIDGEEGSLPYHTSDDEMSKVIVAAMMAGRRNMFFDNLEELDSIFITRAVTQRRVSGRVLGHSRMYERDNLFNWIGTGNNTLICPDMHRRIAWIMLNAETTDLTKRKFKHADFQKFVLANRGIAIHHILTVIRYWQSLGEPNLAKGKPIQGFEGWSNKIGGVLEACGVEGFLTADAPIPLGAEQAEENEFLIEFLKKYRVENPQSLKNIYEWAEDMEFDILSGKYERKKRLGEKLNSLHGNPFDFEGDTYFFRKVTTANRTRAYKVVRKEPEFTPNPEKAETEEGLWSWRL